MSDLATRLRDMPCDREPFTPEHAKCQCRLANEAADEIERLQNVIDSRPAINAGLPETYIKWSQSIYVMEYSHETKQTNQ